MSGRGRAFQEVAEAAAQERVRDLVLEAYAEYEEAAAEAAS